MSKRTKRKFTREFKLAAVKKHVENGLDAKRGQMQKGVRCKKGSFNIVLGKKGSFNIVLAKQSITALLLNDAISQCVKGVIPECHQV